MSNIIDNLLLISCILCIIVIVNSVVRKKEHLDLIDTSDNNPLIKELKKMKEGFEKLGSIVNVAGDGFKNALKEVEKAANIVKDWSVGAANTVKDWSVGAANTVGAGVVGAANTVGAGVVDAANRVKNVAVAVVESSIAVEKGGCPNHSYENWAGDCMGIAVDREDGRNEAEARWFKANDLKWSQEKGHYRDGCSWNRHEEAGVCFRSCPSGTFGRAYEKCFPNGADSFGVLKRLSDRWHCPNKKYPNKRGLFCYP
jgi:hypothetical protein